jgi:hypothetical protein
LGARRDARRQGCACWACGYPASGSFDFHRRHRRGQFTSLLPCVTTR